MCIHNLNTRCIEAIHQEPAIDMRIVRWCNGVDARSDAVEFSDVPQIGDIIGRHVGTRHFICGEQDPVVVRYPGIMSELTACRGTRLGQWSCFV